MGQLTSSLPSVNIPNIPYLKSTTQASPSALTHRHIRELLFRSLLKGDPHSLPPRPPLPAELIHHIFSHANFLLTLPVPLIHERPSSRPPSDAIPFSAPLARRIRERDAAISTNDRAETVLSVSAHGADEQKQIVQRTPRLVVESKNRQGRPGMYIDQDSGEELLSVGVNNSITVSTWSADQGWVTNPNEGSWSWFEIGIAHFVPPPPSKVLPPPTESDLNPPLLLEVRRRPAALDSDVGTELCWRSHNNPMASKTYEERKGKTFGPEHEIWDWLKDGDTIFVRAHARFPGWKNRVVRAEIGWQTEWRSVLGTGDAEE